MNPTGAPGADVVQRARDGDRGAFTEIVRHYDHKLRGLSYRLVGGDAGQMDDAMQNAYLKAYQALPRFRSDADIGTWLYRIVYNASIDEARRARRRPEPVDTNDEIWAPRSVVHGPDTQVSVADATVRALAALPLKQRVAVVLVDGEGFDHDTAAKVMGVAPGTVASRLSRARAVLRRALSEESR